MMGARWINSLTCGDMTLNIARQQMSQLCDFLSP